MYRSRSAQNQRNACLGPEKRTPGIREAQHSPPHTMSLRGAKRRSNLLRASARTVRAPARPTSHRGYAPNKISEASSPDTALRRSIFSFRAGRPPGRWSTRNDMQGIRTWSGNVRANGMRQNVSGSYKPQLKKVFNTEGTEKAKATEGAELIFQNQIYTCKYIISFSAPSVALSFLCGLCVRILLCFRSSAPALPAKPPAVPATVNSLCIKCDCPAMTHCALCHTSLLPGTAGPG